MPILTIWEGSTGEYKPEDSSTSPTAESAGAEFEGLYFPVLPAVGHVRPRQLVYPGLPPCKVSGKTI